MNQFYLQLFEDAEGFRTIIDKEEESSGFMSEDWDTDFLEKYIYYDTKFRAAFAKLKYKYPSPVYGSSTEVMKAISLNYSIVTDKIERIESQALFEKYEKQSEQIYLLENADTLILSPPQHSEIQIHIDGLRAKIQNADWLASEHRQRILDKTNELQREFDREISSFYKSLGMLKDLGDGLGEFGKRSEPLKDSVVEIINSLNVFKKNKTQIGKDPDPLQIPDLSDESDDRDDE